MTKDFRKLAAERRAAVPQIDLTNVRQPQASEATDQPPTVEPAPEISPPKSAMTEKPQSIEPSINLTSVDTTERPISHGFQMYPSRHRQLTRDLVYLEDRNPWLIIDDALEEYVVRHYGKEHKRL